jgi:fumarate reductase subunit D
VQADVARPLMKNDSRSRNHPAYWAFLTHRISGVALTLFLPLHFWALGNALQGEAKLDSFLRWSEQPLVKCAEVILVLLLAAHMAGGVRLLMLEFMDTPSNINEWHKTLLACAAGVSVAVGVLFLLNLV